MVLIAVVAVAVLVLGGLVFILGRASSGSAVAAPLEQEQVIEESAEIIAPIPDEPAPTVEPIPEEPTVESIPEEPTVESTPTPVETVTETSSGGGSSPSGGASIPLGAGISVTAPAGWTGKQVGEGQVSLGTEGGGAFVLLYTVPSGASGTELISFYIQEELSKVITDLEYTAPESLPIDVPSVVSAGSNLYRGTYVGQQGSQQLDGILWAFIRSDGTAVLIDGYFAPGANITEGLAEIGVSVLNTM